jgi:hypothetical protein
MYSVLNIFYVWEIKVPSDSTDTREFKKEMCAKEILHIGWNRFHWKRGWGRGGGLLLAILLSKWPDSLKSFLWDNTVVATLSGQQWSSFPLSPYYCSILSTWRTISHWTSLKIIFSVEMAIPTVWLFRNYTWDQIWRASNNSHVSS